MDAGKPRIARSRIGEVVEAGHRQFRRNLHARHACLLQHAVGVRIRTADHCGHPRALPRRPGGGERGSRGADVDGGTDDAVRTHRDAAGVGLGQEGLAAEGKGFGAGDTVHVRHLPVPGLGQVRGKLARTACHVQVHRRGVGLQPGRVQQHQGRRRREVLEEARTGCVHQEPGGAQGHQPPDVVGLRKLARLGDGQQQLVLRAQRLPHSGDDLREEGVGDVRCHQDHDRADAFGQRTADPVHHVAQFGDGFAHPGNVVLRDPPGRLAVGHQRDSRGGDAGPGGHHCRGDPPRTRGLLQLLRGFHTSIVMGAARASAHEVQVRRAALVLLGRALAAALRGGAGEDHQDYPQNLDG
ncbi:hypothetical protein ARTHRO9AX_20017 [Arthrobacter sp. 9AX]|nr:hypothetical protein ARTHRO9AX_20017 [Arthrobacter sp. 9AX]